MSAKSELIDATWNPRLVKTPVPIMFAITRFVAVMTEIFLRLIESGNSLLVIRGSADLSMEKNTEFGQDVKWKDGRREQWNANFPAGCRLRDTLSLAAAEPIREPNIGRLPCRSRAGPIHPFEPVLRKC